MTEDEILSRLDDIIKGPWLRYELTEAILRDAVIESGASALCDEGHLRAWVAEMMDLYRKQKAEHVRRQASYVAGMQLIQARRGACKALGISCPAGVG